MPLYMLNLQTPSIHHAAEAKLAHVIEEFRKLHPDGQLSILAHSAGCGVALGALKDLPPDVRVNQMVLLAPSVSPEYHLVPSIAHLSAPLQVFYSGRDRLWLDWRTSTFGTYDNIKTKAAGNIGFNPIPDPLRPRLIQHSYDSAWSTLGNDGDHYGPLAKPFVRQILAPLLQPPRQRIFSPNPPPARS